MVGDDGVEQLIDISNLQESAGENGSLNQNAYFEPSPHLDFSYENDRRALIGVRNIDGANTPLGHTYSNILELRENWEKSKPGDFCQQHIPRQMLVQERRLAVHKK